MKIEKECLGVVINFERYLVCLPCVMVLTDHKPLIPFFMKQNLADTPVRCQRMLMSDTSQHCCRVHTGERLDIVADINIHVDTVCMSWSVSDTKSDKLRKATTEDITLGMALEYT